MQSHGKYRIFKTKEGKVIAKGFFTKEDLNQAFIYDTGEDDEEIIVLGLTAFGQSLANRLSALKGLWKDPV